MVQVPESFIVNKFFQFVGAPKYNKYQHIYNGSCPICREGKSWLKKKRCYYIPKKNIVCCHNCGWYSNPFNWIKEVGGYNITDLVKEIKNDSGEVIIRKKVEKKKIITESLPSDSVNLFDDLATEYYSDNYIIQKAKSLITQRKLDVAINRPDALYVSLTDVVHKNRLTIPFFDSRKEISFYQSRRLLDSDTRPKYLSKVGAEKSIFGIDKISTELDTVFITEGPIDAFFIKNGLAVAGITQGANLNFTQKQEDQLKELFLYNKVWVLDNQHLDVTSKQKTKALLEKGYQVFIWPEKNYKDLNDLCIEKNLKEIDPGFILQNTCTKLKGILKLSK